jgi:Flp pilus assembly protein TadD
MTTTPSYPAIRRWLLVLCALCGSACASSRTREREVGVARVRLAFAADRAQHRDWEGALSSLEPLPKDGAARAAALTLRGTIFREKGMLEEAQADLEDALNLRSDVAATHASLGIVFDLRHDLERGATHHARAVELEPENARYLNDLAFSLFIRGKAREAIPVYQRALRAAPEDRRIRNNLGFAFARTGEFSRATHQFALGGTPAQAKNNLGYAYEQAGNLAQAFERYLEAARLDPTLREARENLRHVAETLDRKLPPDIAGAGGQS